MACHPRKLSAAGLVLAVLAATATGATYTVINTNDAGAGSLRQAILNANGDPGSSIAFNIPGTGVHTIAPATVLPDLTQPVTINGYTQPGSAPNTSLPDQGLNSVLKIEIDCTSTPPGGYCLHVGGNDVTIRGLAVNRGAGAFLIATDFFKQVQNLVIEGCYIGTSADGLTALPAATPMILGSHKNARIGGTAAAARNLFASASTNWQLEIGNAADSGSVIDGNFFCTNRTGAVSIGPASSGIVISGGSGAGNTTNITIGGLTPGAANVFSCKASGIRLEHMKQVLIQGNRIGVDPSGTKATNGGQGIGVSIEGDGEEIVIGGTAAGAGNVIGGMNFGISTQEATGTTIQGNFIGTDVSETLNLGNASPGINMPIANDVVIGGVAAGEANSILHNRGGGVSMAFGSGTTIRGNRILDNWGAPFTIPSIGIDLKNPTGQNVNDPGDSDTGSNGLQNTPLLTSAAPEAGGTRVIGTLDSTASSPFTIDFYASPICRGRPRSQAQADKYLGAVAVSTNSSGHATFNTLLATPIAAGQPVTATATDGNGSTSELSSDIVFSTTPDFGISVGGQPLQVHGMLFSGTPTVTVGGIAATNVSLDSETRIFATAPALPAGTVNDIVVTVAGGLTGRLRSGYVSLPSDVGGSQYAGAIAKLVASGITLGCGAGIYCPDNSISRAEMAIFLVRAKYGLCFTPPAATGTMFSDVPAGSFGARQIELLASLGVSTGCGGGKFCPNGTVTRDQMAVFLLRTLVGSSFVPPAATGMFTDVPVSNVFAKWIEELARRGITGGCGFDIYCPDSPNTRGEMAAFISRTFGLP